MFKKLSAVLLAASFVAAPAFANDHGEHGDAAVAQAFIKEIQADQAGYASLKGPPSSRNWPRAKNPVRPW